MHLCLPMSVCTLAGILPMSVLCTLPVSLCTLPMQRGHCPYQCLHFAYVSVHILHILVYILPMLPYQTIHTMSVYFIHTMCVCILPMSVCTLYNIHVNVPSAHVIY